MSATAESLFPRNWTSKSSEWDVSALPRNELAVRINRVPKWLFVAGGCRVTTRVPVTVELHQETDMYFAECPALHVFASGESYDAMWEDLDRQVCYFHGSYTSLRPNEVTGMAASLRDKYLNYFHINVA